MPVELLLEIDLSIGGLGQSGHLNFELFGASSADPDSRRGGEPLRHTKIAF